MKYEVVEESQVLVELGLGTELYYCFIDSLYNQAYLPLTLDILRHPGIMIFKKSIDVDMFGKVVNRPLVESDIKMLPHTQTYFVASLNRDARYFGPVKKGTEAFETSLRRNVLFKTKKEAVEYSKALSQGILQQL